MAPRNVRVHPSAVVEAGARIEDDVVVGPLCYVGNGALLGRGTELIAQATVLGPSEIGARNRIFPHATLGASPQDKTFAGEATGLFVGDDNVFREGVTVHRGTKKGDGTTRVGSNCLFLAGSHVAHDCVVGDSVTLTNNTSLGGHVRVGDRAVLGGHVAVAPFVTIGELSFAAGGAMIERDVPPYVIVAGDRARVRGLNRIGLIRAEIDESSRAVLERAYRLVFRSGKPLRIALAEAELELPDDALAARLLQFLKTRI